ncbi:gamma-glutamylcyclotransferase [Actibacterium sp. XHP0104]|uniref:gamma-glutamylcyclotransferase n=1 Tax=Actibacterium sp. XHP0104 TaxID=2984335 RepID=UPI0021E72C3F|nr:gamma-glutamylcyclotransferase [Actibacterium sp. XHP0104]MCV2882279.1 gamma-glutamylcyclotransferase [Actibacterium sp. XHP0104]
MGTKQMWVFGYGSLMWNPGFPVAERKIARLDGFHRSFCMRSLHHRGTHQRPGLVLALDALQHGTCQGLAFRVEPGAEEQSLSELRERELVSAAYLEVDLAIDLRGGGRVRAITYIIDPDHVQYCGGLPLEEQAQIIAAAHGGRGPNSEYLFNTAAHLHELGIADDELDWLDARVREILMQGQPQS